MHITHHMLNTLCLCGRSLYRSCVSHRLDLSHIDLSSSISWCKCLSTILSVLLLARKTAFTSTSWYLWVSVTPVVSSATPLFFLIVRSCLCLIRSALTPAPPPFYPCFTLICSLSLFSSRLYLSWARPRKQSILPDSCRFGFFLCPLRNWKKKSQRE